MGLKINYNVSAMVANNALKMSDNKLSASLERLSSGYKINHAKDNAAGLAIARRMNAQIRGLSAAEQDAKDGESVIEIADGALAEVHDILQRMSELSVKASNGTSGDEDRKLIQDEISKLQEEITRIGESTQYNSQDLFDGSFDLKGYTNNVDIKVDYYSDAVNYGQYSVELTGIQFDEIGNVELAQTTKAVITRTDVTPNEVMDEVAISGTADQLVLKCEGAFELRLGIEQYVTATVAADGSTQYSFTDVSDLELDLTGIGAMTLQIGANEGQTIDLRIPEVSLLNLGVKRTDVSTVDGAKRAIDEVSNAIQYISEIRSRLGAYQNRLQHTQTNLATSHENVTAAYSRIMDTDMADEMTEYSNLQVVTQAATSILAQANERPSQVLQLLQ